MKTNRWSLKILDIDRIFKVAISKERAPSGHLKNSVKRARNIIKILENDLYKCRRCKSKTNLTIDHTHGRKFAKHNNFQKYDPTKCRVLCERCHVERNLDEHYGLNLWECPTVSNSCSSVITK